MLGWYLRRMAHDDRIVPMLLTDADPERSYDATQQRTFESRISTYTILRRLIALDFSQLPRCNPSDLLVHYWLQFLPSALASLARLVS